MKDTQVNLGIRVLPRSQALGIVSRTEVDRLIGSGTDSPVRRQYLTLTNLLIHLAAMGDAR